jgi:A/G-specific adenine glycosylase
MTNGAKILLSERAAFQKALLAWYASQKRDLPWRRDPSLYKTVVSEFMLQQTQVKTMLPYFARWLEELPDFKTLAQASEEKVLKLWEGLGYYSRARNLHRLAKALLALPVIPHTSEAWQQLPGIGPYSSAAITSISFHTPAACVDGNVVRILSRLSADEREFNDSATAAKAFSPLAHELLNCKNPGDHNQAMMELGATLCTRQSPSCVLCPVGEFCAARKLGRAGEFPRLKQKLIEQREVLRGWVVTSKGLLLHKAQAGARRLAHMHELPSAEQLGLDAATVKKAPLLLRKKRSITRYQIEESIHSLPPPKGQLPADLLWVPLSIVPGITLSGPHRRWVEALLKTQIQAD